MFRELIQRITAEGVNAGSNALLIGGHAITRLGHARMTLDVDFLVRRKDRALWDGILVRYGYQCYSEAEAFAQYSGRTGWPRIDLMLVDETTFTRLDAEAVGDDEIRTPSPRHMVALKLHAARSASRSKPDVDWEDIRNLVRIHSLDPNEPDFRSIVLRYGDEESLAKIEAMWHDLGK